MNGSDIAAAIVLLLVALLIVMWLFDDGDPNQL